MDVNDALAIARRPRTAPTNWDDLKAATVVLAAEVERMQGESQRCETWLSNVSSIAEDGGDRPLSDRVRLLYEAGHEDAAEVERLRAAMKAVASMAGRDWITGQLALCEALDDRVGPNLMFALQQAARAGGT